MVVSSRCYTLHWRDQISSSCICTPTSNPWLHKATWIIRCVFGRQEKCPDKCSNQLSCRRR